MTTTLEFLQAILADEGLKVAAHIQPGYGPRHFYCKSIEELAKTIAHCDTLGGNVYHACATYVQSGSREAANVAKIKALWLDIDVAPKSSYRDAEHAAEAVVAFCNHYELPVPLFVASGRGLHCYWTLDAAVDRPTWHRYALALKAACEGFGLEAGRERTADAASILRPPGSHWRKEDPAILVEAGPIPPPVPIETFARLLQLAPRVEAKTFTRLNHAKSGISKKLSDAEPLDIVDIDGLAARCAQVGLFKLSNGEIPEPLWHAHAVLFTKIEGGDATFHAWSEGHPNYSYAETARKLQLGRETSGPTTCNHFASINPQTCAGCPFKVATPLQIATAELAEEAPKVTIFPPDERNETDERWKTRRFEGFTYGEKGELRYGGEKGQGENNSVIVCNTPIYLDAVLRGEIKMASHFYRFRFWLPHRGWQHIETAAGAARGMDVVSTLANMGLNIRGGEHFRNFVAQSVDCYNQEKDMETQYEQYGWKEEHEFLYGDRLYRPERTYAVPVSSELGNRNRWLRPTPEGNLREWKRAINGLFGTGSEGQSFAIIAAFAAPLMRFINDSEGGAILSLVTRDTAGGKSTSLAGAYTVWGSDRRALSMSDIDTGHSKESALGIVGNLPVFHDEFVGDPEIKKQFVRMFTEGRGRQRLDRDGTMRHSVATWQTILFTASNSSLADDLGTLNGSDAMAYRVLEFKVKSGNEMKASEADRLRKTMEQNAGHAGHAFLEYIVRPDVLSWIKDNLPAYQQQIYDATGFGKAERYWVRTLACVAVAAQIVEHLELVDFSSERIMRWAIDYFKSIKRSVSPDAKTFLSMYINEHAREMLVVPTAFAPGKRKIGVIIPPSTPNRLTMRREEDTGTYFIDYQAVRRWLTKQEVVYHEWERELTEEGICRGKKLRVLGAGTNIGGGSIQVIDIDGSHPAFTGMVRPVQDELAVSERYRHQAE